MNFTRCTDDRVISGVCGGIAHRWGLDPWLVRALAVASLALPGPGVLAYLLLTAFSASAPMRDLRAVRLGTAARRRARRAHLRAEAPSVVAPARSALVAAV